MLCEALSTHSELSQAECKDSSSKKQHQSLQSRGRAGQSLHCLSLSKGHGPCCWVPLTSGVVSGFGQSPSHLLSSRWLSWVFLARGRWEGGQRSPNFIDSVGFKGLTDALGWLVQSTVSMYSSVTFRYLNIYPYHWLRKNMERQEHTGGNLEMKPHVYWATLQSFWNF